MVRLSESIVELPMDVSSIAAKLALTAEQTDKNSEYPAANLNLLAQSGLLGLLVPTELGGFGANAEVFYEVVQQIAEACASTAMIFVMHCCAVEILAKHLAESEQTLTLIAKGKHISSLACSERGTGANFYASFSESAKSADGFSLNGEKSFVTSGGHADSYVVSTRAVGSDDSVNTSLYHLSKDAAGLVFEGNWSGLGLRGNCSINMKLKDCKVPESSLIGAQGKGFEIEMGTILPRFLLGSAAVYNGIALAALNATITHAKSRTHLHSGSSITALPVIRNQVARMKIGVDSSLAFAKSAAKSMDDQAESALISLLSAKQLACTTAVSVTTLAMETAGGIAFSGALSIERHFRDAQAGVVMAPTNAMLLDLVGRAALGLPLL